MCVVCVVCASGHFSGAGWAGGILVTSGGVRRRPWAGACSVWKPLPGLLGHSLETVTGHKVQAFRDWILESLKSNTADLLPSGETRFKR